MKISFVLTLLLAAVVGYAQPTITLMTFESYTFQDKFDTEYGTGEIGDGFQWGGGFEVGLSEVTAIELIYQRLDTDVLYDGYNLSGNRQQLTGTVGINYIMLGGTRYLPINEKISGFGTLDMGVGWFEPSAELESDGEARFSIGGRLGLRIMASEKVSIRLHTQLFSPVQWAGGGVYFGTGGTGAGVSTGSTIWQFNLGGSLNYRLK